jgi:light-regulated signal transduction histidine kinase (bacteriophytochrome)
VDSGAVVAAVIERLSPLIRESGAAVRAHQLPTVMSDELELGQVFQNLISNAVKFRADRAPSIEITAEGEEDGMWRLSVSDNGIGIDAKFSERIFQMFQRLHERGKYEGSGIGLAIAKKIVERHGGRIWFVSSLGQGTTFHFTLPAQVQTR